MAKARAGWAEIDITPPLGIAFGGRGAEFTPARAILDQLFAQVLVLEGKNGLRALWISLDLCGMSYATAEPLRHELSAATGIGLESVVLNSSHTHSGPMTIFERFPTDIAKPEKLAQYEEVLKRNLLQAAVQATDRLGPVTVSWHEGSSDVAINRRGYNKSDEIENRPNPRGRYNPDLWVLNIVGRNDRCVLFCYACHPVLVYPFAWDSISADLPGSCRRELRNQLGAGTHCQFVQSFAGNVKPRALADMQINAFRKSTPDDLSAVGKQLASDILNALESDGEPLELDLATATTCFQAWRGNPLPIEHWEALSASDKEVDKNTGNYWVHRYKHGPPLAKAVPWPIGLIRLSEDHYVIYMAGEVVAEWLDLLRQWIKKPKLMPWAYCQDQPGYLPTDELLAEGGYEATRSNRHSKTGPGPFRKGLNDAVHKAITELQLRLE